MSSRISGVSQSTYQIEEIMAAGHLSHTLALAGRSIRADENRVLIHLLRGMVVIFIVFIMMMAVSEMTRNDAPGQGIFYIVATINSFATFLAAIAFFPSTITEEKEARTLGLLRMADVGPMAIIAGKSLPRLGLIVALLVIQIPIVLLAVTLGGVTWQMIVKTFLSLVLTAGVLCGLATFISVMSKSTRTAASVFVAILLLTPIVISIVIGILVYLLGESFLEAIFEPMIPWLAPLVFFTHFFDVGASAGVWSSEFLYFAAVYVAVAGAFFFLAWLFFDRASDSTAEATTPRPFGLRLRRDSRSSRRPWAASLAWKDFWFVGGGALGFTIRMVGYPLIAVVLSVLNYPHNLTDVELYLFWLTACCLFVEIAVVCSRLFRHDLDNYTWSSLMMLPKSVGNLVWEKSWGASLIIGPSLFWLLFSGLLTDNDIVEEMARGIQRDPEVAFAYLVFFGDVIASALMIVYLSLRTRYGAIPFTIVFNMIGWTLFGMLMALIQPREPGGPLLFLCFVFFVISVVLVEQIRNRLVFLAAVDE